MYVSGKDGLCGLLHICYSQIQQCKAKKYPNSKVLIFSDKR